MSFHSSSYVSAETNSSNAGKSAGLALKEAFKNHPLRAVIVYASVAHDARALLRGVREILGPDVRILGCSVQGLVGNGTVREGGYMLGAMGLGGDSLKVATAVEAEIGSDTRAKGKSLAAKVKGMLSADPNVLIVLYDPLCNADVEEMLAGISEESACPIIGGGAGQPFGPIIKTYQYWQDEVIEHAALAIGLSGPFVAEVGVCHGTSPTGIEMVVTRSDKNRICEIDGRPALDVWTEILGCTKEEATNQESVSNWAIGIERTFVDANGTQQTSYFVRASFGVDFETGAVIVQAAIPEGTRIMLHHRAVPAVTEGTVAMGRDLLQRLGGRHPWAVLGFECGARTSPFLGEAATLAENLELQKAVAPDAGWLGMMAWGEIAPFGGKPAFHNYTYPLLVLTS